MFEQEHKVFIVKSYFRNGVINDGQWSYSIPLCMQEFRDRFPYFPADYHILLTQIQKVIRKFRETGSVSRKPGSGPPTKRTAEVIQDVEQRMQQSPRKPIRRLAQEIGLSYGACQKIVKKDLHMFPYKITAMQQLLPRDFRIRLNYCQWFLNNFNDDILDRSFFSDEGWFHLSGYLNKQNMRLWASVNPNEFIQTPLHSQKVGVWMAVSRRRIIGPIFFQGTINAARYRNNLLQPFIEQLHDDELLHGYFQQDNATAHTTRESIAYLSEFFDNRIVNFPPRSPDLTIMDYFIFPYLKNTIFKNPVHTLEELMNAITNTCNSITPRMLQSAFANMTRRVNCCIEAAGSHFEYLL